MKIPTMVDFHNWKLPSFQMPLVEYKWKGHTIKLDIDFEHDDHSLMRHLRVFVDGIEAESHFIYDHGPEEGDDTLSVDIFDVIYRIATVEDLCVGRELVHERGGGDGGWLQPTPGFCKAVQVIVTRHLQSMQETGAAAPRFPAIVV